MPNGAPTDSAQAEPLPRRLRRAAFVDRDGTLNPDFHYLADAARLELYRGVPEGIRLLREHGYLVICVTNQSGVERGLYTAEDVDRIHARLNEMLRRSGAEIDAFYYCPHAPERGCACRKPGTELFTRAAHDWAIDLPSSAMIGDRGLDVRAGERLGMLTVFVPQMGHVGEAEAELRVEGLRPDLVAPSFRGAVQQLLTRG
ncbi:MAG: HAD family hydrolase [Thermoplasmata archaeon]|nr:HAD family hydrolase [Thermoplasmata archaeon]